MAAVQRPIAFVLVSTNHGTMIVNRHDYACPPGGSPYGVGFDLLETSTYSQGEVDCALMLLRERRNDRGDGAVAIDCGANIGVHTLEWARLMTGWGDVYAFEAQEKLYYALAGNIALNNFLNVRARLAAVGAACGMLPIPHVDYCIPSSFGSLELIKRVDTEYIGQPIDYDRVALHVEMLTIDSLNLERIDLIKIDVEGMEMQVLLGAANSIRRCKPHLIIEIIKSNRALIADFLNALGYRAFGLGSNIVAMDCTDPLFVRMNTAR
jgi:FkbM family methyltransferase